MDFSIKNFIKTTKPITQYSKPLELQTPLHPKGQPNGCLQNRGTKQLFQQQQNNPRNRTSHKGNKNHTTTQNEGKTSRQAIKPTLHNQIQTSRLRPQIACCKSFSLVIGGEPCRMVFLCHHKLYTGGQAPPEILHKLALKLLLFHSFKPK